jgi:hypothetical protein
VLAGEEKRDMRLDPDHMRTGGRGREEEEQEEE